MELWHAKHKTKLFAVNYHNMQGFTTFDLKYPNSPKKLAGGLLIHRSLNLATVNTRPSYGDIASDLYRF